MKFWSNSEIPGQSTYIPEKRLLAAVLQRAITDFLSGDRELAEGARVWLLEEDEDGEAPLSFSFVCEALDLDPESLRQAIFSQGKSDVSVVEQGIAV